MNAPGSSSPTPAPPPVAPAAAPPPEPPRPPAEAPRPSRHSFLAGEGWLMVLSLVLAVMVWYVVRDVVDEEKTREVTVLPVAPPGHVAVAEGKVKLQLRGKRGEVEEALAALGGDGWTVRLKVAELVNTDERSFDPRDEYQFPFVDRLLDSITPRYPPGEVVRLVSRMVPVRAPKLEGVPTEGLNVRIEMSRPTITISAPAKALRAEIEPDPIDVGPMTQPGRGALPPPTLVTLTFERWRRGVDLNGISPVELRRVLRYRADVSLPEVTATLRFDVVATGTLTNAVEVIVKRGYEVREITPAANAAGFTGTLTGGLTFVGKLTATKEILKDLEERTDGWRWMLVIPESDLPKDSDANEVTARLVFVAFERFRDLEAQGYIRFEPLSVPVQVARVR